VEIETKRIDEIRTRLTTAFAPTELEIIDESDKHKGHAGAGDGHAHFRVTIVSTKFTGRTRIERHRMVFQALMPMLKAGVHALSICARAAPGELPPSSDKRC
jgi:BolA protein